MTPTFYSRPSTKVCLIKAILEGEQLVKFDIHFFADIQ